MRQCRLLMSTFVALGLSAATATTVSAAPTAEEVLASYADIAHAGYGDADHGRDAARGSQDPHGEPDD
jgi:uncharacterized iron-regulated protein